MDVSKKAIQVGKKARVGGKLRKKFFFLKKKTSIQVNYEAKMIKQEKKQRE